VAGIPVLDRRPLLAGDVRAAFEDSAREGAWIATPLHLHALARAAEAVPRCRLVLVSTMPLATDLAAQAEALASAPVMEIYGSTETGVVAMRRTAHETNWRPVGDVRVEPVEAGTRVWGGHFASPRMLADQVEPGADGTFKLLGRQADLIKIAGRRASLAGLNLLLQNLPGLTDGVFYLPATGSPTERLVLIHAAPALDRAAVRAWLRARMDPAFLPRSFIQVERLPRTDAGKLARAALDAIYASHHAPAREGEFDFEFRVDGAHPSLPGHFPGNPVAPGVLLLDGVMQAVRALTGCDVAEIQQVKFTSPLLPGEQARGRLDVAGSRVGFRLDVSRAGSELPVALGVATLRGEAAR
jgi:3-hydroxymyristoyl/3-hydroxydecanoyl-(acyl carrier protein) dehydratase